MTTRLLASLLAISLSATAWADTCAVPSELLADRLIVRLLPGSELATFLAVFESDHPGVAVTLVESVPGRSIHLLALQTPPDYTPADFLAVADDLDDSYGAFLDWGEFLYANETPEGTTGSTFVDHPASAGLYKNQYATSVTGTTAAHARSSGAGTVVAVGSMSMAKVGNSPIAPPIVVKPLTKPVVSVLKNGFASPRMLKP